MGGARVELTVPYTLKVIRHRVIKSPILPGTCKLYNSIIIYLKYTKVISANELTMSGLMIYDPIDRNAKSPVGK